MSMRSIERIVGWSINTVDKLLRDAGEAALAYHDKAVRGVKARRISVRRDLEVRSRQTEERACQLAAWRSDHRRLLDMDGVRCRQQVAGLLHGRRAMPSLP
jgi:hypothetical protein